MPTCTLNLGDFLPSLWTGKFDCDPSDNVADWPWAVLIGDTWQEHGEMVGNSHVYMPGLYDRPQRNIALKMNSGYKAKEWQGYLFGLAPALLDAILGEFLQACRSISQTQLAHTQNLLDDFHPRLHFARTSVHAMLHVGLEVPRLGPPGLYSQWTLERTIWNLGLEIRQPSKPYANLSERALQRCQLNALRAMIPELNVVQSGQPSGSMNLGEGYSLLRPWDKYGHTIEGGEAQAIQAYIHTARADLGIVYENVQIIKLFHWGRLKLPTEQIARSYWRESLKPWHMLCRSRCVRFVSDGNMNFGEVIYFFQVRIGNITHTLALVRKYSLPDKGLLRASHGTVLSIMQLDGPGGLQVIDCKAIKAVVSVQPFPPSAVPAEAEPRFFVWEKIGLEMSLLPNPIREDED
ncbi:hypothetical protein K439DRAFT_1649909 [Ramaria rubella]|nr:hypothetical protein K439DRAFT_1649909 [Ramaria rubella]